MSGLSDCSNSWSLKYFVLDLTSWLQGSLASLLHILCQPLARWRLWLPLWLMWLGLLSRWRHLHRDRPLRHPGQVLRGHRADTRDGDVQWRNVHMEQDHGQTCRDCGFCRYVQFYFKTLNLQGVREKTLFCQNAYKSGLEAATRPRGSSNIHRFSLFIWAQKA